MDKSLDKNPEKNENIDENDLTNFKNSFSKYLIEDKDKQLITQSFSNIENIIRVQARYRIININDHIC